MAIVPSTVADNDLKAINTRLSVSTAYRGFQVCETQIRLALDTLCARGRGQPFPKNLRVTAGPVLPGYTRRHPNSLFLTFGGMHVEFVETVCQPTGGRRIVILGYHHYP